MHKVLLRKLNKYNLANELEAIQTEETEKTQIEENRGKAHSSLLYREIGSCLNETTPGTTENGIDGTDSEGTARTGAAKVDWSGCSRKRIRTIIWNNCINNLNELTNHIFNHVLTLGHNNRGKKGKPLVLP